MAKSYIAGETKIRPGIYQRFTNNGGAISAGARDGVNAIVTNASWGPVGVATVHETAKSIRDTYGNDALIKAALAIKTGGAQKVYIYRPAGSGGAKGTATLGAAKVEAKYPGARALKVKVQAKPGSTTTKQFMVIEGTTVLESFDFAVNETDETAALIAATAKSNFVVIEAPSTGAVNAAEVELTGGKNATLTAENYGDAFYALEPYTFNVLSTDTADTAVATLLGEYVKEAYDGGKFIIGVAGAPTTVDFATRVSTAKAFNNKQMVYFGSGWKNANGETIEGVEAINLTAGIIAATPSNEGITHTVISGATENIEHLTNAQYEEAIQNGLLLLSTGPDGEVWFDSAHTTLTTCSANEDEGWKKIRRVKTRFEAMDRIDRTLAPKIGKINCDKDGVAYIIQSALGVIEQMKNEKKLSGGNFYEDPDNPHGADSAWFIIELDDNDSLEKIYLHYQFRYSVNS